MLTAAMTPEAGSRREPAGDREGAALSSRVATTPPKTQSPKARSLSDSTPRLEPSPKIHESARMSKDDHTIDASPSTPRRPDFLSRGLSLHMPPRESHMPSPAHFAARVPLSPQLDARNTYASPGSVLPRRSRGAEFSRACTNLHHSTLPDQSSPDSSPTITQKGIKIPARRPRSNSMLMDSPNVSMQGSGWSHGERTAPSSSVGSINMMGSDDSSSSSDEVDPLDPDDHDDPMITTPQAKTNVLFPASVQATMDSGPIYSHPAHNPTLQACTGRDCARVAAVKAPAQPAGIAPCPALALHRRRMARMAATLHAKLRYARQAPGEKVYPFSPTISTFPRATTVAMKLQICLRLQAW